MGRKCPLSSFFMKNESVESRGEKKRAQKMLSNLIKNRKEAGYA